MKKRSSVLNSPRLKQIKRKRYVAVRKRMLFFVLFLIAVTVGLVFLSRWREINIQNIEISGNNIVETKDIEKVIRDDLAGKYLFLFPKTNFLLYPKNKIKRDLETNLRRLKDITLTVTDTKNLTVSLSERTPAYTWCGDGLVTNTANLEENKCYFMDKSGYIFDLAPYFSGEVYFRFFGKVDRSTESPLGYVFSPENLDKLISFKDAVSKMGIKPASFFIKDDGDVELYLSSDSAPPDAPKIIFKGNADFTKLEENLQAALGVEPFATDFNKKYSSLLYIDLRFGNKVYYKFK